VPGTQCGVVARSTLAADGIGKAVAEASGPETLLGNNFTPVYASGLGSPSEYWKDLGTTSAIRLLVSCYLEVALQGCDVGARVRERYTRGIVVGTNEACWYM
jgi:hypothetical protein